MKRVKQALRLLFIILLLILAASGIGIGNIFYTRERYMDKEIKIERVEKKEDEEDDETNKE